MKIIAEAGCNWYSIENAKKFIDKSKELNLFATKFQIYNDDVIKGSKHYEFLKSIMLDKELTQELFDYGKSIGQEVFFTPMYDCIDDLEDIGVSMYKIRFKDRENFKLLGKVIETKKPIFLSTDNDLIYESYDFINLLCIPEYPAEHIEYFMDYVDNFNGISDHTSDLSLLKEAESYGFEYFELHVKLNDKCIESKWSKSFDDLKEVLNT